MLLTALPAFGTFAAEATELTTTVNEPFTHNMTVIGKDSLGNAVSAQSSSFRIPAMVTLKDGTIVAAADIRWNTTYDGGGLDTYVAYSSDGGVNWDYTLANYLGDNGNEYNGSGSTAFIDPCLTVGADGQTVYMLCDIYPYGVALNGSGNTAPAKTVGFNSNGKLLLSNDNHSSYGYYLDGNTIYSSSGSAVSSYTVDEHFNLFYNGTYRTNLFFSDSPYKVVRTGFLYLTKSTDGGKTWSDPTLLNLKTSSEQVCLVGPGSGITTSDGTMIFPIYSYNGSSESQRMGFLYSTDGTSWQRVNSSVSWSSEAAVVELDSGDLRFFYRNGTSRLCYVDYDRDSSSWGSVVNTGIATNSNTQISAISHSRTSDGKQVLLVSCPAGSGTSGSDQSGASYRVNGRIFVFTVDENGSMTRKNTIEVNNESFMYSCLTERSDGSVAILYEDKENAWGTGTTCYYEMDMKAYAVSELGITLDEKEEDDPLPDGPASIVTSGEVTVSSRIVDIAELTVYTATAPTGSHIEEAIGYDVYPVLADGSAYTDYARVTVKVPADWDVSDPTRLFGYVKSGDTLTYIPGTYANSSLSFTVPHFSEVGLILADETANITESTITLEVSSSKTVTIPGVNYAYSNNSVVDSGIANFTVTGQDEVTGGTTTTYDYTRASVTCNNLINGNSTSWRETNYYYTPDNGTNYYPLYAKRSANGNSRYDYTWGYLVTGNSEPTQIGTQTSVRTSSTPNITVYSRSEQTVTADPQPAYTTVTFNALGTGQTKITIGENTYTVIVKAKLAGTDKFMTKGSATALDPVGDLGFAAGSYTISYEVTESESDGLVSVSDTGVVTASADGTGEATVVASVRNARGAIIGEVTYTVTVSDVVIEDAENVFIPVGGTYEISGLTGSVYTGMYDEDIAAYTYSDGTLNLTGVSEGKTSIVVGNVQFNVYVNNVNPGNTDSTKSIYVYVDSIEHCSVYFAINGGTLHRIEGSGALIDQEYTDGINVMFFAAPEEGYALTQMVLSNSDGQYYSLADGTLADGSDTSAWPFDSSTQSTIPSNSSDSAWVEGHGFRWALLEGNFDIADLRDMFTRALALGAEGATTFTKNGAEGITTNVSFVAEELPTFEKTIVKVNGKDYVEGTTLKFGDVVTYQFTVTSTSTKVNYTNITLTDSTIGYSGTIANFTAAGTYTKQATYTITEADIAKYTGGKFVNSATLSYSYASDYANATKTSSATASAECLIDGLFYYSWDASTPAEIVNNTADYALPASQHIVVGSQATVQAYTGAQTFDVYQNGHNVGYYRFDHWEYNGADISVGDSIGMSTTEGINIVGVWIYVPTPPYPVSYTWGTFAPTSVTLPEIREYYENESYNVDGTFTDGMAVYETVGSTAVGAWTFKGWYDNSELEGSVVTPGAAMTMGISGVTYYGEWEYEEYSVNINYAVEGGVGGSVSTNSETLLVQNGVASGSTATPSANYSFVGWYDEDGNLLSQSNTFVPSKSGELWADGTTYYARFEEASAAVNYEATVGGSVSVTHESVGGATGQFGGSTATANSGYSFAGWYYGDTLVSSSAAFTPALSDAGKTFTARFTENRVTIYYEIQGPAGCGSITTSSETLGAVSGIAEGSVATASTNFRFIGWYDANGNQLGTGNALVPSKSGELWADGTTYYARFEYDLTSLTVTKQGCSSSDENQTFLFRVFEVDANGNEAQGGVDLTVTVHGNGSVTIDGLTVGKTYKVVEITDWSWRYSVAGWSFTTDGDTDASGSANGAAVTLGATSNVLTMVNTRIIYWLDGNAYDVNIFKKSEGEED